jgi:hypothetical protein
LNTQEAADFLAPSRLVDSGHPEIAAAAARVIAGAADEAARAIRLHDFVRDEIRFGWAPAFEQQRASEVLQCRIGFCNTKSTLFIALLRACGIPARTHFATITRRVLKGLIRPPAPYVDHSWTEVLLGGKWIATDSYNVDLLLQRAAVARCRAEGRLIGYGVHVNGTTEWNGRAPAFVQFVNDGSVPEFSDENFGSFADLDAFRATGRGCNPTHLPGRLVIRWLIRGANRRVARLRSQPGARS